METIKVQHQRFVQSGFGRHQFIDARTDVTDLRRCSIIRFRWTGVDAHHAIYAVVCGYDLGMGAGKS